MVPKIIHQIWLGSPIPDEFANYSRQWVLMHPQWKHVQWGENNLGWLKNSRLYDMAERYVKPDAVYQFRSDLARYEILHRYGGVYIDMDTQPLKPIDELLDVPAFAAWEKKDEWVNNAVMGSEPMNDFLMSLIKHLDAHANGKTNLDATYVSGPRYITPMYFALKPDMVIYPTDYFFPYNHRQVRKGINPELKDYPNSYAVHHWNHARTVRNVPMEKRHE